MFKKKKDWKLLTLTLWWCHHVSIMVHAWPSAAEKKNENESMALGSKQDDYSCFKVSAMCEPNQLNKQ